ncbi:MAG: ABC transporter ATP-binding protein [Anaerolineae bacterium]|nr:ABC transporter ATP-binding protein [Anaerolineae bacterium]
MSVVGSQVAVQFDHVSKRFNLRRDRPRSFQEMLVNLFRPSSQPQEEFWALRDVSFSVERGQVVGFIGANGAGKSSLLKLVNGILPPTEGQVIVNGRVSGLLELGAGFHPDLTGRENIYLNGSILGLSRRELDRLFPSIVAFSELDQFIDAPVKHYSSGMYMRLGFAVAIHSQPDILLVDEVLAVGDAPFQAKCMNRILDMKKHGVTILFVTHDMEAVRKLCDQALWLDESRVRVAGRPDRVIAAYLDHVAQEQYAATYGADEVDGRRKTEDGEDKSQAGELNGREEEEDGRPSLAERWGTREVELVDVEFLDASGQPTDAFNTGDPFVARLHYVAHHPVERPIFGIVIHNEEGVKLTGPNTVFSGFDIAHIEGRGWVDYALDELPLHAGVYLFTATVYDQHEYTPYDHQDKYHSFRVRAGVHEHYGPVRLPARWAHHAAATTPVQGLANGKPVGVGQKDRP